MFFNDIETNRLLLKNISFDDREFILKQFSDDRVNRYLFDAEPVSNLEESDEIIDFYLQKEPRDHHRWIIILKETGAKIGTCGFHFWDKEENSVDIGYDLQEEYRGQGIMTEALKAILSFCVSEMGAREINAHIFIDNIKSIQLAERLGFTFSGKTKSYSFRGNDYPHNIYTMHYNTN